MSDKAGAAAGNIVQDIDAEREGGGEDARDEQRNGEVFFTRTKGRRPE